MPIYKFWETWWIWGNWIEWIKGWEGIEATDRRDGIPLGLGVDYERSVECCRFDGLWCVDLNITRLLTWVGGIKPI